MVLFMIQFDHNKPLDPSETDLKRVIRFSHVVRIGQPGDEGATTTLACLSVGNRLTIRFAPGSTEVSKIFKNKNVLSYFESLLCLSFGADSLC